MLTWIAPVLVFGLVIFVHELGHFLAAKAAGVYTPRFSIGFGPALFKRRYGETEYVLALLPLGGYVRMASRDDDAMALIEGGGERPPEELPTTGANAAGKVVDEHAGAPRRRSEWDPDAMYPFGPKQVPPNRWFESKSLPARLVILLAGVPGAARAARGAGPRHRRARASRPDRRRTASSAGSHAPVFWRGHSGR